MIEKTLDIATADGAMNTFVVHPERAGPFPVVLFYMDAPGWRDELRDMARRLASVGYFVVLPNLYYRLTRDFWLTERTEEKMAHMFSLMATLDRATTVCDTDAMLRFVDASPEADGSRIGAVGYCMSGPFVMWAAAEWPERLRAIASIHGANMVTDRPTRRIAWRRRSVARAISPAPRSTGGRRPPTSRCSRRRCATRDAASRRVVSEGRARLRLSAARGLRARRGRAALGAPVRAVRAHPAPRGLMPRRWNGWGGDSHAAPLSERAKRFLAERIGVAAPATSASRESALQAVGTSRLPATATFRADAAIRLDHAFGQSLPDWIALRYGRIGRVADGVALPASHAEAAAALEEAKRLGAIVIPYGGGTSVVGHLRVPRATVPSSTSRSRSSRPAGARCARPDRTGRRRRPGSGGRGRPSARTA
jgi:dienelactone hydrolase